MDLQNSVVEGLALATVAFTITAAIATLIAGMISLISGARKAAQLEKSHDKLTDKFLDQQEKSMEIRMMIMEQTIELRKMELQVERLETKKPDQYEEEEIKGPRPIYAKLLSPPFRRKEDIEKFG